MARKTVQERLTPNPVDLTGNLERIRTLEFDEADAYLLVRAIGIAINTALMSQGDEAVGRLNYYRQQLKAMVPEGADLFEKEHDVCEIAIVGQTASKWTIYRKRNFYWSKGFYVFVVVDDRVFRSRDFDAGEEAFEKMKKLASNLVGLDCEFYEHEDVIGG